MYRLYGAGVRVPVVAGIMPVTNPVQIKRICAISGTALPQKIVRLVDRYGSDPAAMKQAGIAYAIDQISDLIAGGVDGIHLYTMNNPAVARQISDSLSSIRKV